MNKVPSTLILWFCAIAAYVIVLAAVLLQLQDPEAPSLRSIAEAATEGAGSRLAVQVPLTAAALEDAGLAGILMPLGPGDKRLPGDPRIWDAYLQSRQRKAHQTDSDGFGGLQAVTYPEEYTSGTVSELFFSGTPQQIFRRGSNLLYLDSKGQVQIIDCSKPSQPRMSGALTYHVQHMDMQGNIAFLLLRDLGSRLSTIVVADLSDPHNPLELRRISLHQSVVTFLIAGHRLVVSCLSPDQGATSMIALYEMQDDDRVVLLGETPSTLLAGGFLTYGNYLLVPDLNAGIHVYDFRNPLEPVVVASLPFPDRVRQFVVHGDTGFIIGRRGMTYVINLLDPEHPVVSSMLKAGNYPAYFIEMDRCTYFFTLQGYLEVFNLPTDHPLSLNNQVPTRIPGPLLTIDGEDDFVLLGDDPDPRPEGISGALKLAGVGQTSDSVAWHGGVAVLQDDGLIRFLRPSSGSALQMQSRIRLPGRQHWLAAGRGRLYVGGGSSIYVLVLGKQDQLILEGQVEIAARVCRDGLVIADTLAVAAGKDGLLTFSLEHPARPVPTAAAALPRHLMPLLEVQQLASPGGNRLLAAAGPAGLMDGLVTGNRFQLTGLLGLASPVKAVAVINQLCLAATSRQVSVIDLRSKGSLQNLGAIAFPDITRLIAAPPGYWAGQVPGRGWSVIPAPQILQADDYRRLQRIDAVPAAAVHHLYKLTLFNDEGTYPVPGLRCLRPGEAPPQQRKVGYDN